MPINPTYPGVYIEEIPSGVRTLTGVATSVTAFIGRARRGPVDEPVTIFSYADFERGFGGLWQESDMSYAVRDFYGNGGGQGIIVRIALSATTATKDLPSTAGATPIAPTLNAANHGEWGNSLIAAVDHLVAPDAHVDAFNLTIKDTATGNEERFLNVVVGTANSKHPRYLPEVLKNQSDLVRMVDQDATKPDVTPAPPAPPAPDPRLFAGGADGDPVTEAEYIGNRSQKTGLYALEKADIFNLLCIPNMLDLSPLTSLPDDARQYCEERRAMMLIDPAASWSDVSSVLTGVAALSTSTNTAIYFPRLVQPDPLRDGQLSERAPCGAVAGVIARTDAQRGIWKAPAGLDATLNGVPKLSVSLTDNEIGQLNPKGVNCLKAMPPAGRIVWGARTRKGDDQLSSEWKYIPIRRLALYIEESLFRGTQWIVFEPNDEPLWAQIRLNIGAFMNDLFRKGAFFGSAPADAYFVKCDSETTTQSDINKGIVNIEVGFAPLKPAEFVIIKLQQIAGQLAA